MEAYPMTYFRNRNSTMTRMPLHFYSFKINNYIFYNNTLQNHSLIIVLTYDFVQSNE